MSTKAYLIVSLLMICIAIAKAKQTQKKIIFLYNEQKQLEQEILSQIQNNHTQYPLFTVDCASSDCTKYKVLQYPALIFWNGPGTSFKKIYPPNNQGVQDYFKIQREHPLKAIRDFMQNISLVQAFGVAIVVASFLFVIFSFLFKDRTGLQSAKNKKGL